MSKISDGPNDFAWALTQMRDGHKVRRDLDHPGWAPGVYVDIAPPGGGLDEPFMRIADARGRRRPWTPGQWDLLGYGWVLADEL